MFNGIAYEKAEAGEAKYNEEDVIFEILDLDFQYSANPITGSAHGSGPQQTGYGTIKKILHWSKTAHANHNGDDNPESIQKPVAEKDLQFMMKKEIGDGLDLRV